MYNIAIDGPAGAGKSTIAKIVAKELGFIYVDTGAMYRTIALACFRAEIKADETEKVIAKLDDIEVTLGYDNGTQKVYLNGEDVSLEIRREEIGNMTSAIAVYEKVRENMVEMQRELAAKNDVVMDGRDIGTCVLPEADVKIFLTDRCNCIYLRRTSDSKRCKTAKNGKDQSEPFHMKSTLECIHCTALHTTVFCFDTIFNCDQ